MDGARSDPPYTTETSQAAGGGPLGVGNYACDAMALLENGYAPIPIRPGQKVPAVSRWSQVAIDAAQVERWAQQLPSCGVGLRTGELVGVDIDVLDADLVWQVADLARRRLGETLMRVGLWPKRLLLYRIDTPLRKIDVKPIEVLGAGQQFVAFGIHPEIGKPYGWPQGETPLDVPLVDLPPVDEAQLLAFVAEARALFPATKTGRSAGRRGNSGNTTAASGPVRDESGKVVDGRDAWLSTIAFHAVHDAVNRGEALDLDRLTDRVWSRFAGTAALDRPRKGGTQVWSADDAVAKVRDKLRLHAADALPAREIPKVTCAFEPPTLTAEQARQDLEETLAGFCADVMDHASTPEAAAPRLGIRATTGLGKSSTARRHLIRLRANLATLGAPDRILVFTPSHRLAEETALAWRAAGLSTAVLKGYDRTDPLTGDPMCRELDLVRAALATRHDPQRTVCKGTGGRLCAHFASCPKQRSRREVAEADVVLAPYDALYSGFAGGAGSFALIVIDEACWARAIREDQSMTVEGLTSDALGAPGSGRQRDRASADLADRHALRQKMQQAFMAAEGGSVTAANLRSAGLTFDDCMDAVQLEEAQLVPTGLAPGLRGPARSAAIARAEQNGRFQSVIDIWRMAADLLRDETKAAGCLRVGSPDRQTGTRGIGLVHLAAVDDAFAGKPVLHLDATLRPALLQRLLPGMTIRAVEAAQPHMSVQLVTGRFGKTAIVPDGRATPEERARRTRHLADCVDYVRWQALRKAPGRTLVVTYKAIEKEFEDIPGVVTAHFNATAGLDVFGDVSALIVIGRPLPPSQALAAPVAALFGHVPDGEYRWQTEGVRMRDGTTRAVRVTRHEDDLAESVRAAICDDEVIQCIGRGRGVNRTAETPLEVHILSDLALPLVHDLVVDWETMKPDIFQRMLLEGVAVDSPGDAAKLHPRLLGDEERAKKTFQRAAFKRQLPLNFYAGSSLKSAAYRRVGRGRGWQRAWWIIGDGVAARLRVEQELGDLAGWDADDDSDWV